MASSKEFSFEGSVSGYGDDDVRGDSKKKKFKPLSAVKKFFTKKKEKKDTVVAVKAKSTTALHSGSRTDDEDDDDDGGFRSHPKPLALAGSRSLSEDSVFSPEQRGVAIPGFPKAAVSEDCLPRSAFQSELLSKLTKRQSQYSDDYHDDGLPRSPVPPITTADVILGDPLKKQAGPSGNTSSNRDSDQSLISVDSSENEEEELFLSKWKSSISAKKTVSSPTSSTTTNYTMDTLDLNSIQKTELLVSRAAKDKILVKPQRKTRQNRFKRETSSPLSSLPSLNEESPTKSKPDILKGSWIPESPKFKSQEKETFPDEKPSLASATVSLPPLSADNKIGPVVSTGSKPNLSSITISSKGSTAGTPLASPTTLSPPVIVPTATVSATTAPPKVTTPTSPSVSFPPVKTDIISSPADQSLSTSSPNISVAANVAENTPGSNIHGKKIEKLSSSERGNRSSLTDISVFQLSQSQKELNENKPNIKSRMSQFQTPELDIDIKYITSHTPTSSLPLNAGDSDSCAPDFLLLSSATDVYKTRGQVRSKTLPAVIDEQISPKVQRSSSQRIPNSTFAEPQEPLKNTILPLTSAVSTPPVSLDAKKQENVKFSADSTVTPTGEPSWMSIARKRNADQEINLESEKTQATEPAIPKLSTSAPKSVFTSASSYLEKKRGSIETVSYRNREMADQATKKIDNSDAKLQSVDLNSQNRLSSNDVSSVKREAFESVEISHLGSVKASRNIFDAGSKSNSQKDNVHSSASAALATSERIKQFSSSSSGVSISSSGSVKPGSNVGQEPAHTIPAAADNGKAASGITHVRSGSVKTSPSKTTEIKPAFKSRSGSIKGSTSVITTESNLPSEPTICASSKTEPASAIKPDNPGSSVASALPSAPHVSTHVAAQSNTSLPSQTSSVTPVSFYVKPFTAYSSTPATYIASASRSANATIRSDIKLVSTSTTTTNPTPMATNTNSTTTALTTASNKGISILTAKTLASTSATANISTYSALSSISSSSVTSSTANTSSSSSSILLPTSRSSSVRPHSSFTTSSAFKPHIHNLPSHPTSTSSSINKSPSFKAVTISTEKVASIEKMTSVEKVTSVGKVASEKITDVKKPVTPAKVPAWRTHLTKEVKIEIIENSPSAAPPSSTSTNSDILRHGHKGKPFETPKRTESSAGAVATVETDKSRRSSKVLDLVKNFQNLQAPS